MLSRLSTIELLRNHYSLNIPLSSERYTLLFRSFLLTHIAMSSEATHEAFVLHRSSLNDSKNEDAWSKPVVKPMDQDYARKLLLKVNNKPVDVATQLAKYSCDAARMQIEAAVKERQSYEGSGSGHVWIVAFVQAHTKQKKVKSKTSAYQHDLVTYTASIDVILARVPSGPSPYRPFQVPQGVQPAQPSTPYQPYLGVSSNKAASLPVYEPATPVPQKRRHRREHRAYMGDSDTSDSETVFSGSDDSGDTPATKPSSDNKHGRGRSLDRKKDRESRHGSPGRRPGKQRQKPILHQEDVDKIIERKVAETLKQERAEEERKRKEREQDEKAAAQDRMMEDLQRQLAALKARERRDVYDGRAEYGRRRYEGPDYYH